MIDWSSDGQGSRVAKTAISIKLTPQEDRELRLIVRRQKAP